MSTVARCFCGKTYDQLGWLTLEKCGNQQVPLGPGVALVYELRHCRCGSTISPIMAADILEATEGRAA